jgi:two-component system cell cycle response regulator CtrA
MHLYLFEPRSERLDGLVAELTAERIVPVPIRAAFFRGDLSLLRRAGQADRPFLMADTPETLGFIALMRAAGCQNPVLVMRDFRSSRDTARALDAGADDDIVVPVKGVELRSRINSITRRAYGHAADRVQVGEVTAYFDGRDPDVSGATVKLSRREHAIFQQLALNAQRVISKAAIYDAVYGMSEEQPFDKVIDVYICKIRKKLAQAAASGHQYIETVAGRGYKFAPVDEPAPAPAPPAPRREAAAAEVEALTS